MFAELEQPFAHLFAPIADYCSPDAGCFRMNPWLASAIDTFDLWIASHWPCSSLENDAHRHTLPDLAADTGEQAPSGTDAALRNRPLLGLACVMAVAALGVVLRHSTNSPS